MKSTYLRISGILVVLSLAWLFEGLWSCTKLVEVSAPITSLNAANVYTNDGTAIEVLTGVYAGISSLNSDLGDGSLTSMSLFPALYTDELTLFNSVDPRLSPFYFDALSPAVTDGNFWSSIYQTVFSVNSAVEGLTTSTSVSAPVKNQLLGEAKFIRALSYFYLVNLYGDVPLITSSDYKANSLLARTSSSLVWQQIISDLKAAESTLGENYLDISLLNPTMERVRPTKWAAAALLARTYLYNGMYDSAETQASLVINNSALFSLDSLSTAFLKNSSETIWSLQPVGTGTQANTGEGAIFILPSDGPNDGMNPVYLSQSLINSFEPGDQRKVQWCNNVIMGSDTFYYAFKYKIGLDPTPTMEYIMVLRLAEQYLIRSEARTEESNFAGAQADLNVIRLRAGLDSTTAQDKASLESAILHERQVELFTEWGNRFFDLKRSHKIDSVMNSVVINKSATWNTYMGLFPLPQSEIALDPNLLQNPGY